MTPAEVQEIMRRMWAKNAHVLCRLYALKRRLASHGQRLPAPGLSALKDAAAFRHAYRMFFVQTVAVPPNNVRPPARMGDATFEHTQNVSLIQVQTLPPSPIIQLKGNAIRAWKCHETLHVTAATLVSATHMKQGGLYARSCQC